MLEGVVYYLPLGLSLACLFQALDILVDIELKKSNMKSAG